MCHLNVWFWVLKHEQRVLSFHHIDESTRHTIYYARTYAQHRALETSDKLFLSEKRYIVQIPGIVLIVVMSSLGFALLLTYNHFNNLKSGNLNGKMK